MIDLCPVCHRTGTLACIDAGGRDLPHDHPGRPQRWPYVLSLFGLKPKARP